MGKYYLPKYVKRDHTAGSKAVLDAEYFIEQIGFKALYKNTSKSAITRIFRLLTHISKLNNRTLLVVPYPIHSRLRVLKLKFIRRLFPRITLVCLIHDIPSLRTEFDKVDIDMEQLNIFDHLISHNPRMSQWLVEHNAKSVISNLELFDYKADINTEQVRSVSMSVCFAGNLNKSGFIYRMGKEVSGVTLYLYGPNLDAEQLASNNVWFDYKGSYDADVLHNVLEGSFGLVWDGDDIDQCSGDIGNYLRFNNPHKISLYIAAGLPIIVWEDAAIAVVVEQYQIGFTIASLRDLRERIQLVDKETYAYYVRNMKQIQSKVANGYHIKSVINEIVEQVNSVQHTKSPSVHKEGVEYN